MPKKDKNEALKDMPKTRKGKKLVTLDETNVDGRQKYSEVKVALPLHDADIELIMPNGETVTAQWRVEGPSLDIQFSKRQAVHNWKGDGMKPAAKQSKGNGHVRKANQLMIPLTDKVLEKKS